jgi:hypothetical protein
MWLLFPRKAKAQMVGKSTSLSVTGDLEQIARG